MKSVTLKKMKEELKEQALEIRELKSHRPLSNRKGWRSISELDCTIYSKAMSFRLKHIVYCLLRGRTMEEIERPREGNRLSQDLIDNWLTRYRKEIENELFTI